MRAGLDLAPHRVAASQPDGLASLRGDAAREPDCSDPPRLSHHDGGLPTEE